MALNALSDRWLVAERAITFKTAAGKLRNLNYEDVSLSMTEGAGTRFFGQAGDVKAALFCADNMGWTVTVAQARKHWFAGLTVRLADSRSKIVIIWDGDGGSCWDELATDDPKEYGAAPGFKPLLIKRLTHQQQRFCKLTGASTNKNVLQVYYGGHGNEEEEECLELARAFLARCAEHLKRGQSLADEAFLAKEHLRPLMIKSKM